MAVQRPSSANCSTKVPCLFNIIDDAGEHFDVSAATANKDVLQTMVARLKTLDASTWEPGVPTVPPRGSAGTSVNIDDS